MIVSGPLRFGGSQGIRHGCGSFGCRALIGAFLEHRTRLFCMTVASMLDQTNAEDGTVQPRLVLLVFESLFTNRIVEALLRELPGQVVGIVRYRGYPKGRNLHEFLAFLGWRCGWRFVLRVLFQSILIEASSCLARRLKPRVVKSLEAICASHGIPLIDSTDVNQPATVAEMEGLRPDLILSIYLPQRIKKPLLDLAGLGVINLHPSLLPRHRGLFPVFAAIAAGDPVTGVTVHRVEERFDSGPILFQESFAVKPGESLLTLTHKCSVLGARALVTAIGAIIKGGTGGIDQDESQATWQSWPSPADQERFRQARGRDGSLCELWRCL